MRTIKRQRISQPTARKSDLEAHVLAEPLIRHRIVHMLDHNDLPTFAGCSSSTCSWVEAYCKKMLVRIPEEPKQDVAKFIQDTSNVVSDVLNWRRYPFLIGASFGRHAFHSQLALEAKANGRSVA